MKITTDEAKILEVLSHRAYALSAGWVVTHARISLSRAQRLLAGLVDRGILQIEMSGNRLKYNWGEKAEEAYKSSLRGTDPDVVKTNQPRITQLDLYLLYYGQYGGVESKFASKVANVTRTAVYVAIEKLERMGLILPDPIQRPRGFRRYATTEAGIEELHSKYPSWVVVQNKEPGK